MIWNLEEVAKEGLSDLEWTNDCQGKMDYDGEVLSVSTRYWPRGGGFHIMTGGGSWEGNETRPEIKPSAHSSILLFGKEIVKKEFEGETPAEVHYAVEVWVREQVTSLAQHLSSWKAP